MRDTPKTYKSLTLQEAVTNEFKKLDFVYQLSEEQVLTIIIDTLNSKKHPLTPAPESEPEPQPPGPTA